MRTFGKIVSTVLLLSLAMGILLGIQWLGWNGPKWIMIQFDNHPGSIMLSPLLILPGLAACGTLIYVSANFWMSDKK